MLVLAALACGSDDDVGRTDGGAGDGGRFDGGPAGCDGECPSIDISVLSAHPTGDFPLTDGATVPFEWGFQGGTMIRPVVVFSPGDVTVGEMFLIELSHSPDPAAREAYGETELFPGLTLMGEVWERDGALVVGPYDDQIGWEDPTGARFVLDVTVTGRVAAHASAAVELTANPGAMECDPFPRVGAGCIYRSVPGQATITELPEVMGATCADPVSILARFTADDPAAAMACAAVLPTSGFGLDGVETLYGPYSSSCLATLGIAVDAMSAAHFELIEVGTCSPTMLSLDADLTACQEACL